MCRLGRNFLFLGAGSLMFVMQIATGSIAAVYFKNGYVPPQVGAGMLTIICLFVAGFACSWGPLGWLVRSVPFSLVAGCSLVTHWLLIAFVDSGARVSNLPGCVFLACSAAGCLLRRRIAVLEENWPFDPSSCPPLADATAGAFGDPHQPDPHGRHVWHGVRQLHCQLHHRPVLQSDALLHAVCRLLLLCRLAGNHDRVGCHLPARNQGHRCRDCHGRMGHVRNVPSISLHCTVAICTVSKTGKKEMKDLPDADV